MTTVHNNPPPEAVKQSAKHVLFVEGQPESIDQEAMKTFFADLLRVEPFGASYNLDNSAKALRHFHPTYYFLIDRDHHTEDKIRTTWEDFAKHQGHNLLIWPRRELENYLIDPIFLMRSQYRSTDEATLRECIRSECQRRLYIDAANHIITGCRESLKATWIETNKDLSLCSTRNEAMSFLCAHKKFEEKREQFANQTSPTALATSFNEYLDILTGGGDQLEFGRGRWLELLRGKEVMPTVVSRCFKIKTVENKLLQGRIARLELARELLRLPLGSLPEDLQRLRALIATRLQK